MYTIGNCSWNFVVVKMVTLYDGNRIFREVDEIVHNSSNDVCTIYNNYEDAEEILNLIKNNSNKIKITNDSIIDSILDGHKLDLSTLKIYELVPTEVIQ